MKGLDSFEWSADAERLRWALARYNWEHDAVDVMIRNIPVKDHIDTPYTRRLVDELAEHDAVEYGNALKTTVSLRQDVGQYRTGQPVVDVYPADGNDDDDSRRLTVVRRCDDTADEYTIDGLDRTVYEHHSGADGTYNASPDEPIIECVYARTYHPTVAHKKARDWFDDGKFYGFPRGRLAPAPYDELMFEGPKGEL